MNLSKFATETLTNLVVVSGVEETVLALQWAESVGRVNYGTNWGLQAPHAYEVLANQARNWRNPTNQATLCPPSTMGIDATGNNVCIQYKYTKDGAYQKLGVDKNIYMHNDVTGCQKEGIVIVPKGTKAVDCPSIEESPVSMERVKKASQAIARADSLGKLVARGALIGVVTGAGITAAFQAKKLYKKQITWKQFGGEIAKEAGFGAVSGAAVTLFGIAAASAAAPSLVVLGGSIVVGAAVRYGAEKLVDHIQK